MKKIGKLLTVVVVLLSLVGCGCMKKTAKGAVQDYLNQYKNLSSNVINDMFINIHYADQPVRTLSRGVSLLFLFIIAPTIA